MMGEYLRGKALDKRKALLFTIIVLGFILGGFLGSILFVKVGFFALSAPAAICFILAIVYRWYSTKINCALKDG